MVPRATHRGRRPVDHVRIGWFDGRVSTTQHWDAVWGDRDPDLVTWFQATPSRSLDLITRVSEPTEPVVDVGGGASRLVDHLLDLGYSDVIVVDLAASALEASRARLGRRADDVTWLVTDARGLHLDRPVAVWHDRAVFHFLTDAADRASYVDRVREALPIGGHAVIATFGPEGPETCSGLPTCRYDAAGLAAEFGDDFELVDADEEIHVAPAGAEQQFLYVLLRRIA